MAFMLTPVLTVAKSVLRSQGLPQIFLPAEHLPFLVCCKVCRRGLQGVIVPATTAGTCSTSLLHDEDRKHYVFVLGLPEAVLSHIVRLLIDINLLPCRFKDIFFI